MSGVVPYGFTFARASAATYFDSAGVMKTAGSWVARFDYNPATLAPRGLLIEESRTNLIVQSSNTGSSPWLSFGSPIITSNNAGAPDGTATFNKWARSSTAAAYTHQASAKAASSLAYSFSIFAKAGTGRYLALRLQGVYPNRADTCFDLRDGVIASSSTGGAGFTNTSRIEPIGGGVYRCTISSTTSDTHTAVVGFYSFNTNASYQIDAVDTISNTDGYVWGVQLEQAPFPTSYIPTEAAVATRAAEGLYTTSIPWFNAAAGAFMTEYVLGGGVGNTSRVQASLNDGSINNRLQFYNQNAVDTPDVRSGGAIIWNPYINGAVPANTTMKIAMSYAAADYKVTQNGAVTLSQASGALPVGINRLDIGHRNLGYQLNGWVRQFKYWNRALSGTELQRLTA